MKTSSVLVALPIVLATGSASLAQDLSNSGLYGFAYGGIESSGSLDQTGVIGAGSQSVDTDFDNGTAFGFGIGKELPGLSIGGVTVRGEAEFSFTRSEADQISFSGNGPAPETNVAGDVKTQALFANLFADFDNSSAFTPYVGAGLGIGRVEQNLVYGPGVTVPDSSTGLAGQIIVGGAYALNDRVSLTADARYRRFFDVESRRLNPAGGLTGNIDGDFDAVTVNVGVRFGF